MTTYSKLILSASVSGRQIPIGSTGSASPTPIHTAVSGSIAMDEIWIYATNTATASVQCNLLWGGTNIPGDLMVQTIPPQSGRYLLSDGRVLQGGLIVQAYASVSGSIAIDGFVNRISSSV